MSGSAPSEQWSARQGFFRARVKAGTAVAAYESDRALLTFNSLADLCVQEKDAKQLKGLLQALRRTDPESRSIPNRELEILWLEQNYEGALKFLNERRADYFDLPRNRWNANDHRVRCLVRLKRSEEAVREAEAATKKNHAEALLLILAKASTGDVKQLIAAVEKQSPRPDTIRSYYKDDDLGPILKTEAFRSFRDKYPEPPEDPDAADDD